MKKFIMTILGISVFFIGLGSLVEKTTANFKSDAQALELIRKARIAVGGDANINNVRSLTAAAATTNFFENAEAKQGNLEINLELPNRFSKILKIGNADENAGNAEVRKEVNVIEMNLNGGTAGFNSENTNDNKNISVFKSDDGKKIIIKKDADGKVLTEDNVGDDKDIRIAKLAEFRQNEMLRTTLALLLTAPEGVDVGYFYKGEITIDGFSVNIVEAQTNGYSIKLFLDKSSNLPRMISFMGLNFPQLLKFEKPVGNFPKEVVVQSGDFGGSVEHQIKYSDYRNVGGLLLPFAWTETVGGKQSQNVNVTTYEINPPNIADKFKDTKIFVRKTQDK